MKANKKVNKMSVNELETRLERLGEGAERSRYGRHLQDALRLRREAARRARSDGDRAFARFLETGSWSKRRAR